MKIIDVGGIKLAMLAYTFSTNGLPVDSEHPYSVSVYTTDYMTDCSVVDYDLIQSDLDKAGQSGADAIAVYAITASAPISMAMSTTPSRPSSRSSWRTTCLRTVRHWCSAGTRMCRSRWSCGRCRTAAQAICATVSAT